MTESPSLETRLRQLRASHRDGQGGSDCAGVNTGDCDTCDTLDEAAERIVSLHQQLEEAKKDVVYHADCRPNRRQAEAAIADAKAMNDKWADEYGARLKVEARIATLEAELSEIRRGDAE
jgi:hypothetical protein